MTTSASWQLLHSKEVQGALIFCVSAIVGQILHSIKKWADGEISCPLAWLTTGIKRTVSAVIANIAGMLIFIQSGVLGPMLDLPNGSWALFLFGFMQGFSVDSGLNKGIRSEWTEEQRESARQKAKSQGTQE